MRLDIGAGEYPAAGMTTLDAHYPADIRAPATDVPLEDGSCEHVRLSHVLEHIPHADVPRVLKEARRLLSDDGTLYVEVPDLDGIFDEWFAAPEDKRGYLLTFVYGNQSRPGEFHQTGFNAYLLREAVEAAGFTVTSTAFARSHAAPAVAIEATR